MAIAVLILAFIISGGVSFAAEKSLPGNPLYIVKTTVNENVRSVLAYSPEANAAWQAEAAERRMQELVTLSEHGDLTPAIAARLRVKFEDRATAAVEAAAELAENGDVATSQAIASKLESMMTEYTRMPVNSIQ